MGALGWDIVLAKRKQSNKLEGFAHGVERFVGTLAGHGRKVGANLKIEHE
jgi:hypothetical protein